MRHNDLPYRGRFAPSPTGPLHLGSLIAALASYLDARHHRGIWLVRMEDLDPPREEAGAATRILNSLEKHGLQWDEDVLWQSRRHAAYSRALEQLASAGQLFYCDCTRARVGANGACSGNCRQRQAQLSASRASRVAVPPACRVRFTDHVQGLQEVALGRELADFVVKRKDGLDAYQLAVVVDDAWQGITQVVRGADLLDSTARQIYLQQLLGYDTPGYGHLPLIANEDGQKFSKQNHAPALDDARPADNLRAALRFLQQVEPPPALQAAADILRFATEHWSISRVPVTLSIAASSLRCP